MLHRQHHILNFAQVKFLSADGDPSWEPLVSQRRFDNGEFLLMSFDLRGESIDSPQAIRPISNSSAVGQAELWLESVPSRRLGDGYGEVACPRMEVRSKCFADAVKGAAALRCGNSLIGGIRFVCH